MKRKYLTKAQKLEKHKEDVRLSYDIVAPMLEISETESIPEKVRKIVFGADKILSEICKNADKIKIDLLESVQDIAPIERAEWTEFISLATQLLNNPIPEKRIRKINESFENSVFIINMRKSFLDTYVNNIQGTDVSLPIKNQDIPIPELSEHESNPEFDKYLHEGVQIRHYINTVLWPSFKQFGEAAEYITDLKLTYYQFKDLVDWEHYKDGGYPSENSKPKLWSILNNFSYAARLMMTYEFPQIQELFKQFGIIASLMDEHPSKYVYSESARKLAMYNIYKPVDSDAATKLNMIDDEHLIEITDSRYAIYDIETRVIRKCITIHKEDAEQLLTTKNIKETFDWLCFDEESIRTVKPEFDELGIKQILHPSGETSKSKRILGIEETETLGLGGYYGNFTNN